MVSHIQHRGTQVDLFVVTALLHCKNASWAFECLLFYDGDYFIMSMNLKIYFIKNEYTCNMCVCVCVF